MGHERPNYLDDPVPVNSTVTLTPRQREVALAFARGHEEKQLMIELGISESGVKYYSKLFRGKFGIASIRQLAPALREHGVATAEEILG